MLVTLADSNSHEILTIIPPVRVLYSLTNALLFSLNSTSEMLTTNQMKNRSEKVKNKYQVPQVRKVHYRTKVWSPGDAAR